MKKTITGIMLFILLLTFGIVNGQSGTCGENIAYRIEGDTITFSGTGAGTPEWNDYECTEVFNENQDIKRVKISGLIYLKKASWNFSGCPYVEEMDLTGLNARDVEDMTAMFQGNKALKKIIWQEFDSSSVTNMSFMFEGCKNLTELIIDEFDTSMVQNMSYMFANCQSLTTLDLGTWKWDTSRVTNMKQMFYFCYYLNELDLSSWDTSQVTSSDSMFYYCLNLKTLTLGENTLKTNVFDSLTAYNDTWYYTAASARNPLPVGTAKANAALFKTYNPGTMAGTWSTTRGAVHASSVSIQKSDGTVVTGESFKTTTAANLLKAAVTPKDAGQTVNWTSSDTATATVNANGKVSFKKAGMVTIKATAADGSGTSAEVTIVYVPELAITDSKVKGYNKGIKIVIPYEKNVSKYVVKEVYDVAAKKAVKPAISILDSGKYTVIKLSGSSLVNGKVYRIKIYRSHTINGKNYNSNTVTQYAAPNPTVSNLTVNPRDKSVVMTSDYKGKADGIQYRVYNGTTNKQVRTTVLSDMQKSGSIKELTNGELYFAVVRTYKAYNGKKLWTMDSNKVYFAPLSKPAGGKVTFSNSTTAVVSMKKDSSATGIRVLYRGADGKLVNGCEAKGTKCTVENLKKTNTYEFYVMKFKTIDGKKHYGPGVVLPYKMKTSGLAAPSKVVVDSVKANTTFTVTRASDAKGISVLYRENEGKTFKLACEKAADACTKKLDVSKNYTFYVMQYKVVDGKKVYSPGVTVKNWTGAN